MATTSARRRLRRRRASGFATSLALLLALLASRPAATRAHPNLVDRDRCGADAHPSTARAAHAAPLTDPSISFQLAWAAADGSDTVQANELDGGRVIPASWHIHSAEFKPGGRHTLIVTTPCEGEILLTATAGAFVDLGDRNAGSGVGARCSGARYDLRGDWSIALFVWNAPAVAADGDAVEFKVTTAAHHDGGFRTNAVTLVANGALSVGGAAPEAPSSRPSYPPPAPPLSPADQAALDASSKCDERAEALGTKFTAHGWCACIAWAILVPAGAYVARYAKAPRDAPPSKRELLGAIRDSWFSIHRALVSIGLFFAFVGAMLSYSAVEDENAGHMGCAHAYYGVATLLAGASQPLNAFLRADKPDAPDAATSTPRKRWEWTHRITGVGSLSFAFAAIVTGLDEAKERGAARGANVAGGAYAVWVVACVAATIALEANRYRERRGGGSGRNFVELSDMTEDGDGARFERAAARGGGVVLSSGQ